MLHVADVINFVFFCMHALQPVRVQRHLQTSLVQSFVLLFQNFERFGGAPHYNQLAPLPTCDLEGQIVILSLKRHIRAPNVPADGHITNSFGCHADIIFLLTHNLGLNFWRDFSSALKPDELCCERSHDGPTTYFTSEML
jgi:hypothetical protein